jgi:hypothetical protein
VANLAASGDTLLSFGAQILATGAAADNVPAGWADGAMGAPTGASSLQFRETCYWNYGPGCTTSPPSIMGNLMWVVQTMHQLARYSGDTGAVVQVVWPLLGGALQAYQSIQVRGGGGWRGRLWR